MSGAGGRTIYTVVKGSLLTFVLFLLYAGIPFFGVFAGIFVPFPCIYYTLKYNRAVGFSIVLLMIILLALLNQKSLLPYLMLAGTCSLMLPEFLLRCRSVARAVFFTVGLNTCLAAGLVVLAVVLLNVDVDEQLRRIIHESMIQVAETYRQSGLSGKELEGLNEGLKLLESVFVRLYPSIVVLSFGVVAGLNLLLLKRISGSLGKQIEFGAFSQYRNPDSLVWLLILAGFSLLAEIPVLTNVALNVLLLVYVLYFVQGLSVCTWFARKQNVSRILRVIFYVLLAVQPLLTAIVAVIGLTDLWVVFRSQKIKENL